MKDTLFQLSKSCFIGSIHQTADIIKSKLTDIADEITTDSTGSVYAVIKGKSDYKIMLQAHIDEIGMIVTNVENNGFIKAEAVGGIDVRVLPSCPVIIHSEKPVKGIFTSTPPHLLKPGDDNFNDINDLYIDTGLESAKDAINEGDFITFDVNPKELLNDFVTGKAFDNRTGCVALLKVAELIKESGTPDNTLVLCFSSAEELGGRGAKVAAYNINANEAIIVDVSFGLSPNSPKEKCSHCGKGTLIGFSPVLSREIIDNLLQIAREKNISYQYEAVGGNTGTDADVISLTRTGIPCGLLSIPLKYMHTTVETVSLSDVDSTAQLMYNYCLERQRFN